MHHRRFLKFAADVQLARIGLRLSAEDFANPAGDELAR